MRRRLVQLVVLSLLAVMAVGTGVWAEETGSSAEKIRVPDFALLTANNETVRLSDLRGKVVVLNFWATWCPYCVQELPELQELHEEFSETGEAVIYLVDQIDGQWETPAKAAAYLEANGITIPNLLDFGTVGNGIFQVPGLPTTVVIDAEGYLSDYAIGMVTKDVVRKMVEGAK